MSYKHLFFDLDRTLWDFEKNSEQALLELIQYFKLEEKGIGTAQEFIRKYKAVNKHCWALYRKGQMEKAELRYRRFSETMESFGIRDEALAKSFGEGYIEISPKMTALVDGTTEVLNYLSEKYLLHIITNGFREVQYIKLENSGIGHHFDHIIISEDVGQKKPHRMVFDYALQRSGAKHRESLMIGDDLEADVLGARNAGWDQVFYNPEGIEHKEELVHEVKHLSELKTIL
jgi:putative hydrolase of the HAD superfamily